MVQNTPGSGGGSDAGTSHRLSTCEDFPSIQHYFRDSFSLDMVGAVVKLLLDLRYLRNTGIRNLLQYRFELIDLLIAAG
jgi:hypothetical protein